jgi:hypothetical protein
MVIVCENLVSSLVHRLKRPTHSASNNSAEIFSRDSDLRA